MFSGLSISLRLIQLFFFSCLITIGYSQQKQGNIVEYFGKEKINEIREGKLLHAFQKGLVLNVMSARFSSSTTPKDPVFARFLMQSESDIKAGQTFDVDFSGKAMDWETLQVDSTNTFQDRRLRSGYLYLTYSSKSAQTVLLEASGHTRMLINGMPHEGDHYDYGWNLIPLKLKKGKNEFIFKSGRFNRIRARLIQPSTMVQLTTRDMTLPDIRKEDSENLHGAIRVINARPESLKWARIICKTGDASQISELPEVSKMNIRKVPFVLPFPKLEPNQKEVEYQLLLQDEKGKTLAIQTIKLEVKSKYQTHKRTFVSDIDGSVQYYSVTPSSQKDLENPAMFLSVHGASVEATNQARAYKQKDWGHIVAPTNRRAFGFAWEDWGRLDALEVLADAEKIYQTDAKRTYLTGHSMGGHGTWYLGATYPDRFAAIAPCAGYPDLLAYRGGFFQRMLKMSDEQLARFGMNRSLLDRMTDMPSPFDDIIARAGNPSRTLKLIENYNHLGIYVLHGEKDNVVPTEIARDMRKRLGEFHSDFTYYEYPNGTHWYGDHSMDWGPIFDFFQARNIKTGKELDHIAYHTASPGVSSGSHFIKISQQSTPFEISDFEFSRSPDLVGITTHNVHAISVNLSEMGITSTQKMEVDDNKIAIVDTMVTLHLIQQADGWKLADQAPSLKEKGPHRNGGFKDAFRHNMVLVYASQGSKVENEWYYNKARFDAETFWYRANGNVELIADVDFSLANYPDQNIILYGNKSNNSAWNALLGTSPLQVSQGQLSMGDLQLSGAGWGTYFVVPRPDSDIASIGVVAATGIPGMKAAYANHYLVNGTTFPDVLIFNENLLTQGKEAIKCAGFWGNDWSMKKGDFVWK